jgi:hypothetical protein
LKLADVPIVSEMRRGFRGGTSEDATQSAVYGDLKHAGARRPTSDEQGQVLVLFVPMFAVLLGSAR